MDHTLVASTTTEPRRHVWVAVRSKNDPMGTGPPEGRTTVVACHCLSLCEDRKEEKTWATSVRINPSCRCIYPCPFQQVVDYLSMVPDLNGSIREAERTLLKSNPIELEKVPSLNFFRASSHGKNPFFLKTPLGNTIS